MGKLRPRAGSQHAPGSRSQWGAQPTPPSPSPQDHTSPSGSQPSLFRTTFKHLAGEGSDPREMRTFQEEI